MSNTLIVSYLPSGSDSVTKQLLDAYMQNAGQKTSFIHRDLLRTPAPFYDVPALKAYKKRGFIGLELDSSEQESLKPFDELISELKQADILVLAFPMHNFSVPGPVKTWIDAVSQYGATISNDNSGTKGMLTSLKAAVLYASGGQYDEGSSYNTVPLVLNIDLKQLGIQQIQYINSGGSLMGEDVLKKNLSAALESVNKLTAVWYSS